MISEIALQQLLQENKELKDRLNLLESNKNKEILTYCFNQISFSDLKNIVDIKPKLDYAKFDDWFNDKKIVLDNADTTFLQNLIDKNVFYLDNYKEEDLKVKFIAPILNRIDFVNMDKEIRDFYDEGFFYQTDQFILGGETDFVVAKGHFFPEQPYFFIQKFKRLKTAKDPVPQLLAELIAAVELNNFILIKGAFIIGAIWNFVILEKLDVNKYQYFVSKNYDCTDLEKLNGIYKNLLVVKQEILEYANENKVSTALWAG
ncbi:hypothetical protein TI05_11530 [Achromatium sp. WMS3]|nr:hypothetical protein TI05_11530 [Achromatium sp. WMS3]